MSVENDPRLPPYNPTKIAIHNYDNHPLQTKYYAFSLNVLIYVKFSKTYMVCKDIHVLKTG
jgi:hypothetical protein